MAVTDAKPLQGMDTQARASSLRLAPDNSRASEQTPEVAQIRIQSKGYQIRFALEDGAFANGGSPAALATIPKRIRFAILYGSESSGLDELLTLTLGFWRFDKFAD